MERKTKILSEIKIEVVKEYLSGKISVRQIAYQLQVSSFSVEESVSVNSLDRYRYCFLYIRSP